jgi:hypothetical protein
LLGVGAVVGALGLVDVVGPLAGLVVLADGVGVDVDELADGDGEVEGLVDGDVEGLVDGDVDGGVGLVGLVAGGLLVGLAPEPPPPLPGMLPRSGPWTGPSTEP